MISEDEAESTGIRGAGLVSVGRIAQQELLVDPRSIRATTYAKGLKDQLREWYGKAAKPNTRLMTPIACSTLARIFDLVRFFARSISSTTARWW